MTTSIVSPLEVCKRVRKQKGMIKEMIICGLKKKTWDIKFLETGTLLALRVKRDN